jgi:hypothetical protein
MNKTLQTITANATRWRKTFQSRQLNQHLIEMTVITGTITLSTGGLSILLVKNSFTASNTSTKTRPEVNESYFARACLKHALAKDCKNDSRLKESNTLAHTRYMEKRFD